MDQSHIRGLDYVFWDTDTPNAHRIAWDFKSSELDLGDKTVNASAVFFRYNVFEGDRERNLAAFDVIQSYVLAWPEVRILNRQPLTDGNNKSRNLRLAIEAGFEIPDTLVMGDLTPLITIPNPQTRIIKPLNGGAHTEAVDQVQQDVERLPQLGPQFVQSRLDGENLRLFSIGGQLFCFHLKTTALDYREDAGVDVQQIDVPKALVEPTKKLVTQIGFDYCALDFRCHDGFEQPVFLEVNSFPMFVRFDDAGKNCLADAMLDFLSDV